MPGIGKMLSLVLLYAIHDIERFPRGQDVVSYCRLVTCSTESAGKRYGTSGTTIGKAHLQWAFAEAAVVFLRDHAAAQQSRARLAHKHGKGKAVTVLAQQLARAVYDMLKRTVAVDTETCFQRSLIREGRGCACGLTGQRKGAPPRGTQTGLTPCVGERQGAYRSKRP